MSWRDHPHCPAAGTRLCAWSDLPDDGGHEVAFGEGLDALRIVVLRQGERHWAYLNRCPHFSLPLNFRPQTFVTMDAMVVCAHHTAFFNFDDGACVEGPCAGTGLEPVPTARHGDDIVLAPAP